jgi:UDP-GlcNAc3NAcA epimerase
MKKILSIVGARPNFIKLDPTLSQIIVHTGQHYDDAMNAVFFKELRLPSPRYNLGISDNAIGKMIQKLMEVYDREKPDLVIVFGDTNSTAAGAIAAYQMRIPVAHIEAGMRSGDRRMLEEYNRIVSDHIATLNFCPTKTAVENLKHEGVTNYHFVGDVMYDRILPLRKKFKTWKNNNDIYLTCHRAENVDDKQFLTKLLRVLGESKRRIIFPIHPRTKKRIGEFRLRLPENMKAIRPLSYLEGLKAIANAEVVITDSGGVQKEAYFLGKPCLILRRETEWPEIVDGKSVRLIPYAEMSSIPRLLSGKLSKHQVKTDVFGNGQAWKKIKNILKEEGY